MFKPADLFDLNQTEHAAMFDGCQYAWEALKKIKDHIAAHLKPALNNRCEGRAFIGEKVFIGKDTVLEDGVMIKGRPSSARAARSATTPTSAKTSSSATVAWSAIRAN